MVVEEEMCMKDDRVLCMLWCDVCLSNKTLCYVTRRNSSLSSPPILCHAIPSTVCRLNNPQYDNNCLFVLFMKLFRFFRNFTAVSLPGLATATAI